MEEKMNKEKMHTGDLYLPGDTEIIKEQTICQDKLHEYNLTKPSELKKRTKLLKEMLGDCGEGVNCSPSSRQVKKYKFFLPVDYLLAVFMQLASKFHVFP